MKSKKKLKIPKSVLNLKQSPKKFAQKHNIRIKGKHLSKKEKKHNFKRLQKEYSEFAASGLNKAVKILAEHPKHKKTEKVKAGVDNIISNPDVMTRVAKLYKKSPETYPNMIYLPFMIMNTLVYYASDSISEEEKEIGKQLDNEKLIKFCEKVLKKEIKRYEKFGLDQTIAYQIATVIPTAKLLKSNRNWYKKLIQQMYDIAENEDVDIDLILKAVSKIDKKRIINKKDFLEGFFTEFILQKSSNKSAKYTDKQKELHDGLIERSLIYMDNLKPRKLKDILKTYIKRRKTAEEYKNDGKRVIKFTDHAHSNSPYATIKEVVQELIEDNSSNELYLS
jgi:hypothetical protein